MIVETIAVILVSLLLVVYYYGRVPKPLHASETERPNPRPDATPETLRAMIEQFEEKLPIMPGLRTELVLDDNCKQEKAGVCIVYVHGWKAGHKECEPLLESLSKELNSTTHVLKLRLSGHGGIPGNGQAERLSSASLENLKSDILWAHKTATHVAKKVFVIGHSMGGALSTWCACEQKIDGLVLIAPCFGLNDDTFLHLKFGSWPSVLRRSVLRAKGYKYGKAENEAHAKYWVMNYPHVASELVIQVVNLVQSCNLSCIECPVLCFQHCDDQTALFSATKTAIDQIGNAKLFTDCEGDALDHHVICGDIFAPGQTKKIVDRISTFLNPSNKEQRSR